MLGINTFGHEILASLLLLTIPYHFIDQKFVNLKNNRIISSLSCEVDSFKTEPLIFVDKDLSYQVYLCNRVFLITTSGICGLIHRHHLMVWSIFAPKVIHNFLITAIN